jgi:hypothetical protein
MFDSCDKKKSYNFFGVAITFAILVLYIATHKTEMQTKKLFANQTLAK